ncbi:MAG TPA: Wzz/FepE/Etk N-terminal domain-containing protein [Terriglobales bacterium]|nr:Wzz/FepE/Etk N-terminal domain-containing protein [Terriglobales bacterium]
MAEELSLVRAAFSRPTFSLRDLLAVFFRQRRIAVISFLLALLAMLVYAIASPAYQAKMKVLVRRGRVDPVVTPAPTPSPQFERQEVSEEELNSEVELLRDEEILRTVVRQAGLDAQERSWMRFWERDDAAVRQARAVRKLGRRLTVEPLRKTTLIAVNYDSTDPAEAARVLQCLANAYMERHQQVHRPSGESGFFEEQMQQAQRGLEQAELQMIEFAHQKGVVSADLERDMVLQKMSEADGRNHQARVEMREVARRVQLLQEKLVQTPERTLTQIRTADNQQLLEKLTSKLLELQLKRTELLTRFRPTYKLVVEVDEQIAETESAIAAEKHSPAKDETTDQDATHEWARAELAKAEVDFAGLAARAQATGAELSRYQEEAQRLGDRAIFQEQLRRNLKAAEEKYLLYANKREEARIGDALDQGGILNVTIAEQPVAPALPAKSRASLGLLGLLLAGGISTGLAFAADALDPAFRTPDEVIAYLDAPVLASLPRTTGGRH